MNDRSLTTLNNNQAAIQCAYTIMFLNADVAGNESVNVSPTNDVTTNTIKAGKVKSHHTYASKGEM